MISSKRTRILVDPKVQWAIGRRVILHWCLFVVCLITVNMMLRTILSISDETFGDAVRAAAVSQVSILLVMAIMLPMFVLDTMKLSNRFAGPMYRLKNALIKLPTSEPLKPIAFRTGDFWSEVADDFNRVAKQHDALRRRNAELESELKSLREQHELQVA